MGGLNGITKFYKQEDWGKPKEKISLKKLNFKEKKKTRFEMDYFISKSCA